MADFISDVFFLFFFLGRTRKFLFTLICCQADTWQCHVQSWLHAWSSSWSAEMYTKCALVQSQTHFSIISEKWDTYTLFSTFTSYKKQKPWFLEPIFMTHSLANDGGLLGCKSAKMYIPVLVKTSNSNFVDRIKTVNSNCLCNQNSCLNVLICKSTMHHSVRSQWHVNPPQSRHSKHYNLQKPLTTSTNAELFISNVLIAHYTGTPC